MNLQDVLQFSKQFGYKPIQEDDSAVTLDHHLKHVQRYYIKQIEDSPHYRVYLDTGQDSGKDKVDWCQVSRHLLKGDKDFFNFMKLIEAAFLTRGHRGPEPKVL